MKAVYRHTGIVVKDIRGALNFWTNCLGFNPVVDQTEQGSFIDNLLGIENVRVRTIKMTDGSTLIELLNFESPVVPEKDMEYSPLSYGITHIALTTTDIKGILDRMSLQGYKPLFEPQINNEGTALVVYIPAFEGVLLEIVEPVVL